MGMGLVFVDAKGVIAPQDMIQGPRLIKTYSTSVFQRHLLPFSNLMESRFLNVKIFSVFSRLQFKDCLILIYKKVWITHTSHTHLASFRRSHFMSSLAI